LKEAPQDSLPGKQFDAVIWSRMPVFCMADGMVCSTFQLYLCL